MYPARAGVSWGSREDRSGYEPPVPAPDTHTHTQPHTPPAQLGKISASTGCLVRVPNFTQALRPGNCMKSGFAKLTIEIFFTAPTCLVWRVGRPLAVSTTVVLA